MRHTPTFEQAFDGGVKEAVRTIADGLRQVDTGAALRAQFERLVPRIEQFDLGLGSALRDLGNQDLTARMVGRFTDEIVPALRDARVESISGMVEQFRAFPETPAFVSMVEASMGPDFAVAGTAADWEDEADEDDQDLLASMKDVGTVKLTCGLAEFADEQRSAELPSAPLSA